MILLLVALIVCSACLSGAETSLFSLSPMTLKSYEKSASSNKRMLFFLMNRPRDVLVSLLMLNMFVNILVQNTVANIWVGGGPFFKVGVPLVLVLVFGEILPKSIALPNNTRFAPKIAPFIAKMSSFFRPIRDPLTQVTLRLSRIFTLFLRKEEPISADELRHVLHTSEESGILLPEECDLVEGSLDLQESIVKERMRQRGDIVYFDIQEPLSSVHSLFVDQEISRIPVCDGDLERLLGILSVRRYFLAREKIHESSDLRSILKKPYFVPETMRGSTCLQQLRATRESLAVVVDEYGSISGLITQEDLIEAVVGEIQDLRDQDPLYTRSGADVIIASGKLEIAQFKEIFGISLKPEGNMVTLGGWLTEQLGDIPKAGTKYTSGPFIFYVLAADPNRVRRIHVRLMKRF